MPTSTATASRYNARPAARAGRATARARRPVRPIQWILTAAVRVVIATVLPVLAVVGVAVQLHIRGHGPALSIAGGAAAALLILAAAGYLLVRSAKDRSRVWAFLRWIAGPAIAMWCLYALFHLERTNAKTAQVQGAYTTLHPILRLAVSTAILAEGELVVTDASRTAADYRRMGLPVFERTLHYPQNNGWVHAVDVRTIGHTQLRNAVLSFYFRAVGLRVVRHVGTADHLHIELPKR